MTLAVVPARGGSKGIPRKNIRFLAGKPLIAYILESARRARYVDEVVVSTDDDEIEMVVSRLGFKVIHRPPELARDEVTLDLSLIHI